MPTWSNRWIQQRVHIGTQRIPLPSPSTSLPVIESHMIQHTQIQNYNQKERKKNENKKKGR